MEDIGETSGRAVKIHLESDRLKNEAIKQASKSFDDWLNKNLSAKLKEKSKQWKTEHGLDKIKDIVEDYVQLFIKDFEEEFNNWADNQMVNTVMIPKFNSLEELLKKELETLNKKLNALVKKAQFTYKPNCRIKIDANPDEFNFGWGGIIFESIMTGGLAAILAFFGITLIPIIIVGLGISILVGGFSIGGAVDEFYNRIKNKVVEEGLKKN